MTHDYSTQAFFNFLYELPSLGLINEATARNLKNSALLLLSVVDISSDDDVRNIDVEELISKYVASQPSRPGDSSIQSYQSRFKSAVSKFEEYVRVGTIVNLADTDGNLDGFDAVEKKIEKAKHTQREKTQVFNLPIVVRPETGTMITVQGLPTDLTAEEAERILSILKAYVRS
ncbi:MULTISPECIES: hypothetical protein [Citrobacter]|jgi:hypothetical protein|uniref:hypothetical protein n=1 Tax=Citrobacter TaxID=544 RepID=UPI000B3601ED|nr:MULTISPECIES: hypothetical protein [Citrobacter]MBS6001022.1 hypothetical protein [Citrobacter sp.]HCZ8659470.1 hypothetical protein [Citrobacter braakii]